MNVPIWEIPVAVVVWTQDGCPACQEYLPKLIEVAKRYGNCLPTIVTDVNQYPGAADRFGVISTPYTVISRYGIRPSFGGFIDGDGDISRIEAIYSSAMTGLDCAVG